MATPSLLRSAGALPCSAVPPGCGATAVPAALAFLCQGVHDHAPPRLRRPPPAPTPGCRLHVTRSQQLPPPPYVFDDCTASNSAFHRHRRRSRSLCLASSPSHFNWAPPSQICDWVHGTGRLLMYSKSKPGNDGLFQHIWPHHAFWADPQATFMQSSWYMDAEKGIPGNLSASQRLPANYRLPMVLISCFNRMRDLDALLLKLNTTSNNALTTVNQPADVAVPGGTMILFSRC